MPDSHLNSQIEKATSHVRVEVVVRQRLCDMNDIFFDTPHRLYLTVSDHIP